MSDKVLVSLTAKVTEVLATSREREHKEWSDHKRELVPKGYQDVGWVVRVKEPSLQSIFPLADMSLTMWRKKGETPELVVGFKYAMEVSVSGPYRTLLSWRVINEEDEGPDVIDEALASVGMVGGGRKMQACPPPPPPVQPDQAQMELLREKLNKRKSHGRSA